jgi:hypothetical protein
MYIGKGNVFYCLLNKMLITSKNILNDTPRLMLDQTSSHPMVQSSWHIKLTIIYWNEVIELLTQFRKCEQGDESKHVLTKIKIWYCLLSKRIFLYLDNNFALFLRSIVCLDNNCCRIFLPSQLLIIFVFKNKLLSAGDITQLYIAPGMYKTMSLIPSTKTKQKELPTH